MKEISIEYIYHSGFSLETEKRQIIFDYYKGSLELKDKSLFVFVSHAHQDHFNHKIFKWKEKHKDIKYILSDDINLKNRNDNMYFIAPYENLSIAGIDIKTFLSTDQGVSFLIKVDGISIFHAGDLNWWDWWDDTEENNKIMEKNFKSEIMRIKERNNTIDIAFFPLDPRLRENYSLGSKYFIEQIKPGIFIPMHFGEDFQVIKDFSKSMASSSTEIIEINKKGQVFKF